MGHEDSLHRSKLATFLRYNTTFSVDKLSSLEDYVTRMVSGQKEIFYITGETKAAVENSPFIESLRKKKIEVIFMTDPIDEYCIGQLKDYASHRLVCVSKVGVKINECQSELDKKLISKFDSLTSVI